MDDFEPLKLIGKGAFGEVRICRDRSTGKLVAVKKLRKAEMVRRGQVSGCSALLFAGWWRFSSGGFGLERYSELPVLGLDLGRHAASLIKQRGRCLLRTAQSNGN